MNSNSGLPLIAPLITPPLDPFFRPAALANRAYKKALEQAGGAVPVKLVLEQADGATFRFELKVFPADAPQAQGNFKLLERFVKFILWSRGGCRLYINAPRELCQKLQSYYKEIPAGRFDAEIMGDKIYDKSFQVLSATEADLPAAREASAPLGRHLNGCRIGFDLGASDRKAAAVMEGKVVFSEEIRWDPVPQKDPEWHYGEIMDSLKRAALHLPRVDAIGGSAAGVYVNNRVKVASLFRGVPPDLFQKRVKELFIRMQKEWQVPLEVVNDGEVTALAGSMAIRDNAVLGISMGSSQAGGYVTAAGNITSWLNELAFVPIDYAPQAPADEWSGDQGCGVQYFSQQAVGRLMPVAGIECDPNLALPERLKLVQELMRQGDRRAAKIYQTIGTYLGYTVAHYADFYEIRHMLVLGRVMTGSGGEIILDQARAVLKEEFPELAEQISFQQPDEQDKRHGQAVAAASLPPA